MILDKVTRILSEMPNRTQKKVLSAADFSKSTPSQVYKAIISAMLDLCRNAKQRAQLEVFSELSPTDDEILEAFGPSAASSAVQLTFTDEQKEYIKNHVYRNREGEFRIIPGDKTASADTIPVDGLEADERIIAAKLKYSKVSENGTEQEFDGLRILQGLEYDGSEDDAFKEFDTSLRRIEIANSFSKPFGFYREGGKLYRNVACQMKRTRSDYTHDDLERAMFLMYLVSGATIAGWTHLYKVVHNMVRNPNSHTGTILYLNDFDAGGNGKSKFIAVLQSMFGDSFTAFSTQQLRFTISLLGKRLVSIAEFDTMSTKREILTMLKAMTGRDLFEYEAKGAPSIVAKSFQNFVITSNHYVMFDDSGIKRRLQNFQSSNLLHLVTSGYAKTYGYLDKFFGDTYSDDCRNIETRMADALLDYIGADDEKYDIPIRDQPVILSSLKNPILRALFADNMNYEKFVTDRAGGCTLALWRMAEDIKPGEFNYAAATIQQWMPDIKFTVSRDSTSMTCDIEYKVFVQRMAERLTQLDEISRSLKSKSSVTLEKGTFCGFSVEDMFKKFIGGAVDKYKIPVSDCAGHIIVGDCNEKK